MPRRSSRIQSQKSVTEPEELPKPEVTVDVNPPVLPKLVNRKSLEEECRELEIKYGLSPPSSRSEKKTEEKSSLLTIKPTPKVASKLFQRKSLPDEVRDLEIKYALNPPLCLSKKSKSLSKEKVKEKDNKPKVEETPLVEPTVIDLTITIPKELNAVDVLNMRSLMAYFNGTEPEDFIQHCQKYMTQHRIEGAEVLTIDQADTPMWHAMRYGRITASRIHQASRCKTKNGSLVDSIMGRSSGWSFAMQRGTNLEDKVFNILKRDLAQENVTIRKVGLVLDAKYPHFGASPDGIADDFVVEIKCPFTPKTHSEYIDVNKLQKKYYAQIQLQMHITGRQKALLGVADLNFERNKKVTKVWIDYDEEYIHDLIEDAENFWMEAVFPQLRRKHRYSF